MSLAAAPDHRDTSQDESSRGRFQALLARLHALPLPAKGPAFEAVVRWYLENAPQFRGVVQRVFAWREWPGRWGPDAGIDLVAELQSGELWAIQAKAYAPGYSIKKADVDSFFTRPPSVG